MINVWRKGDDDMEPSAKMLAMIDYLKEWEAAGDKSIVYSQCKLSSFVLQVICNLKLFRDEYAGSDRDPICSLWHPEPSV